MSTGTDRHTSVETAFAEVLAAERNALAKIADCEDQADGILRDARHTVRGMVRRTRERISRLHAGCAERTRELVAGVERELHAGSRGADPAGADTARLEAAVRAVARELTTRNPADAG